MIEFPAKFLLQIPNVTVAAGKDNLKDATVKGIAIDSRTIGKDEAFFAIKGENFDGHNFIKDAVEKGANCIIAGKKYTGPAAFRNVSVIKVPDTTGALLELSGLYRHKFPVTLIGITGTNGKTTTKELTYSVLSKKIPGIKSPGSFNNKIGVPLSIFQSENYHEFIIAEMGTNHFGEIRDLSETVNPDYAVITNIGPGHLESFQTLEGVAKAKAEIFDGLARKGTAIIPADEERLNPYMKKIQNFLTFGLTDEADLSGKITKEHADGTCSFLLNNRFDVKMSVPGRFNVVNALAAAAVGCVFNMSLETIAEGIEDFKGLENRLCVTSAGIFSVINDSYNSNPASLKAGLQFLKTFADSNAKRSVAILGDMLELGENSGLLHRAAGEEAGRIGIGLIVGFGPDMKDMIDAVKVSGAENAVHFSDKSKAEDFLKSTVTENDVILVKGSRGMKMESFIAFLQTVNGSSR